MPHHRPGVALAAIALVFLAGACGDDGEASSTAAAPTTVVTTTAPAAVTSTTAAGTAPTTPPASTTAAPPTTAAGPLVEVTYKGGKVDGGGRKQVAKGQTVTLRVTADVVDEVHLHGYDKKVDTVANSPVDLVFKADVAGVFEVELEKKGLKLVELEVK